ncbi:unannotated protein [freshwater metagenome]|uniref:Unannotated protein n=1 Tax=freshwater metagenome TaxID=449393 RepID=A0A6J7GT74_9ZZZZ
MLNLATIFSGCYLMLFRISLKFTNQVVDITIKRCREQQGLTATRNGSHNALHCWHKAHVGHTVGLVNNYECNCTQIEIAALHQVLKTTWGCHNDACGTSSLYLWAITSATVNSSNGNATTRTQHCNFFCNLSSKLTGWHEHQSMWAAWLGFDNFDSQCNTESKGFARACRCLATNVQSHQ